MSPAARMIASVLAGIPFSAVNAGWVSAEARISCKLAVDAERTVSRLRTLGLRARRVGITDVEVKWGAL